MKVHKDPVITIHQVTKDYGNGKGVFDISFQVEEGEVFGYLGSNGAGKTTTIRQLMGFIRPQRGSCQMMGMDCFTQASQIQKRSGYLAGELAFPEDMTGREFLKFMAELKGMKQFARMEELMERFELNPQGKIRKMSKGMKQKVGIVNAFMHNPQAVILDEPTSGLDPFMQNRFVELVLEEKKKGTTILMSSHIFEEVEKTCDKTAFIRAGRIVAVEDMNQLAQKRNKIYTVTLKDAGAVEKLKRESNIQVMEHKLQGHGIEENQLQILVRGNLTEMLQTILKYEPIDLSSKDQSLEELFMHYYGEDSEKPRQQKRGVRQ